MSITLSRRNLLQCIVVTAIAPACSSSNDSSSQQPVVAPVEDGKSFFPQSVASGDPRPDSVILWTRIVDGDVADRTLVLEMSTTEDFKALVATQADLAAAASNDGTLKVKVVGLSPKTRYFYRFVYVKDGKRYASQVGRTKTAPAAGDDTPVSFVVASCQDYVGKYYNAWAHLLGTNEDLDFVLFIGDYIYETTGNPEFQKTAPDRAIKFSKPEEAIDLTDYQAAKSLGNYRDLYKTFRAEPVLQKVHERFPFIMVWDDHEYSDDCWGDVATYTDGVKDERDTERRKNAERAFFEYVPFGPPDDTSAGDKPGGHAVDPSKLPVYPATRIYRDFDFGKHLKLVVADYRTFRPDHIVPENGFPAEVILDEPGMQASGLAAAFTSDAFSYVNIDDAQYATQKTQLRAGIKAVLAQKGIVGPDAEAKCDAWIKGNLALVYVNGVLSNPLVNGTPIDPAGKPKGIGWIHFGKQDLYGLRGSRYFLFKGTFEAYSAYLYAKTQGASENAWGQTQETFIKDKLSQSTATFKCVVSSVTLTNLTVDLTQKADITEGALKQKFLANCDQWDGFPNKKKEILDWVKANAKNTFFVAGDIHAAFASTEQGIPILTTPAISSGTFRELLKNALGGAGYKEGTPVYKYAVTQLDDSFKEGNPNLLVSRQEHGYLLVRAAGDGVKATFMLAPEDLVSKRLYDDPSLAGSFKPQVVNVKDGGAMSLG